MSEIKKANVYISERTKRREFIMTIENLIELLKARDKAALEEFIDNYSMLILKVITYVLSDSYEKEYIEECYDDVIMLILDKCDTYQYKASFKTFVATLAKNKALDYKRKLKKHYYNEDIDEIQVHHNENPEKLILNKEKIEEINKAIKNLKEDEKKLFVKKFILNSSTEDLCCEYKTSKGVIYKRLSRLKSRIKELTKHI